MLFLAEWWSGSDVRVFASEECFNKWGKEHALIIMNHTYEVDWLMGWIIADRSKTLGVSLLIEFRCKRKREITSLGRDVLPLIAMH